jgi:hypothetical protein
LMWLLSSAIQPTCYIKRPTNNLANIGCSKNICLKYVSMFADFTA